MCCHSSFALLCCFMTDVGSAAPIKQHACGCPLPKIEMMIKGAKYLIENGVARPSHNSWSSLCLLAPKTYDKPRFCTDLHKVHSVTAPDSFPLPCMEDFIDRIGSTFRHLKKLPVPLSVGLKVILAVFWDERVLAGQCRQTKAKEHRHTNPFKNNTPHRKKILKITFSLANFYF